LDVQLSAFGGTLAASRVTNIGYNSLINKPVVVLPGYLPPIALTASTQELSGLPSQNGIYSYISSVSPDSGFELFRLSGVAHKARFSNSLGIVITQALPISASISKYALRAGQSSISPSDWTVCFLYVNDIEVGSDTRTSETFISNQSREFDIATSAVRKAILTINNVPSIIRPTLATFVNSAGLVEISLLNAFRLDHDLITLAPRGLLVEEARNNFVFDVVPLEEGVTVETGSAVSPSGAMDAFKVLATTSIGYHVLSYRNLCSPGPTLFMSSSKRPEKPR
jgi:hypothetical protein